MKVQELLATPEKWTKGAWARDNNGKLVAAPKGEAWDLEGAIFYCYPGKKAHWYLKLVQGYINKFHKHLPRDLAEFNDSNEIKFEDIRKIINKLDL